MRAHRLSALVTLVWELCFPVLAVLVLGVVFHIGTLLTLEVGRFSLYAIACYAAFVCWERFRPSESDAKQNSPLT